MSIQIYHRLNKRQISFYSLANLLPKQHNTKFLFFQFSDRVNARKKNCTRLKQIKLVFNFVN